MQVQVSYSAIWKIAYPIMIGSLAQTILGITDTAFLARVGEVELGASAIGGVFYFVLVMIGMGFGIGTQIIMARKAGENDYSAIGKVFDHSLILLIILSVFLFITTWFGCQAFFKGLVQSSSVFLAAISFIKYRIGGIFFIMITMAFRSFYIGIAQTRIITYSAMVMTGMNILLAYVLVFGKYGFPAMGIEGAGLASAISEGIAAFYLIIYTVFKKDIHSFRLFKFESIQVNVFEQIIRLSLPVVLQHIISMGAWFAFFIFIERLGLHELAISNIVRSNYMVLMTPVWGFSSAANSMVSNLIGQRKPEMILILLKKISLISLLSASILVLLNIVFAREMLELTADGNQLVDDSLKSYYVVCLATLVFSVSMILFSGVSGTGATREAMFLEITNITLYLIYVYVFSVYIRSSVEVVWLAEVLYWSMMGIFSFFYLMSNRWLGIKI